MLVVATSVLPGHPAGAALADAEIKLTLIATLDAPIAMATRTGDTNLYFAEKGGKVLKRDSARIVTELLDIGSRISHGGERGLLGLVISPAGDELFVNFTNTGGDTIVRGMPFDGGPIDFESSYRVLRVNQPFANHNGGNLAFGPDGYLYIGMGDGGNQDDPRNHAQRKDSLLGKMLRIDPRPGGGFSSPPDNPYVGRRGNNAIWAKGLRNPWRWSFDRGTGDLWIGDVGGKRREEVNHQVASSSGAENYGWRRMEGTLGNVGRPPANHDPPVFEYSHADNNCSITGGYVYRGSAIPDLAGSYVFADFCVGELRAFSPSDPDNTVRNLGPQVDLLASFGEDTAGELYVLSLTGSVYRIDQGP